MMATSVQATAPVVLGASQRHRRSGERLEELVYNVSADALANAGIARGELDGVVLAASDERDGRSISSMLTAAPAGGLLTEVTKVTDSGLHALALAGMRVQAGLSDATIVVSWDVASESEPYKVAATALEPFVDRPIGAIDPLATALVASAYMAEHGRDAGPLDRRAEHKARLSGARGRVGDWVTLPLSAAHVAPERDGAAAVVLASQPFASRRGLMARATLQGTGWRTATYSPAERGRPIWAPLRSALDDALVRAGTELAEIDSFEVEDATVFHECVAAEGLGLADDGAGLDFLEGEDDPFGRIADDGFVGLPATCAGLWRVAQISAVERQGLSLVHQATGRAAQVHAVAIVRTGHERIESP
jgi:acetyl-CoA acyltransferase